MQLEPTPEQLVQASLGSELVARLAEDPVASTDGVRRAVAELGRGGLLRSRSTVGVVLALEEVARARPWLAEVLATSWLVADALERFSPAATLTGPVLRGDVCCSVAVERPSPGAATAEGTASGESWVVDGKFPRVVLLTAAEVTLVAASGPAPPAMACIRLPAAGFLVEASAPGVGGLPTGTLVASRAGVPSGSTLTRGHAPVRELGDTRRLFTAAIALGLAEGALDRAVRSLKGTGSRPRQATEFLVSDMATDVAASRASVLLAAWLRDRGRGHSLESAGAKLLATRTATRAVHGALGMDPAADEALRAAYLDARLLEACDGTNAELEDTVASQMLGES